MSFHPVARRPLARHTAAGTAVAAALLALPTAGAPAEAAGDAGTANPVTPGSFTGYGFDQCLAPKQKAMDAWLTSSPFWAVGIYISGNSRACRNQPNLSPTWISTQLANGWRLLPITLGPQAYCNPRFPRYNDDPVIKKASADNYAAAKAQGVAEAGKAVAAAQALGIAAKSTLWYDIEAFDHRITACRASTMQFLSGWTEQIRALGFVSGIYSSGASGIKAIDNARVNNPTFTAPDMLWIADWNDEATVASRWVAENAWTPGLRVHQYRGGHDEVHGGVRINIDSNYLDVGLGSVPPTTPVHCGGVLVDFLRYARLNETSKQPRRIKAAQCLLKEKGMYAGRLNGIYNKRMAAATARYRSAHGLPATTTLTRQVWVVLHAEGATPLLKYGAASDDVRRLQRALNATAVAPQLAVTGTFGSTTASAVKLYQQAHKLPKTGVVTPTIWGLLQRGNR
jgi:peptidoglycan hydrolase-like protein with peptidoglycan-binding domain